jgi:hypothetical protein
MLLGLASYQLERAPANDQPVQPPAAIPPIRAKVVAYNIPKSAGVCSATMREQHVLFRAASLFNGGIGIDRLIQRPSLNRRCS